MPPRRRRRSPRRTSRRARSLDYLLAVVLVVGIGYLLAQRGVLPFPPEAIRPSPEANGAGNAAAIGRLGGKVEYGHIDRATGQRSGVRATITPAMVAAAARDALGSAADPDIRPPGLDQLPRRNRARGHLLGRQLGGTGDLAANLVALYQTRANTPVMRDYESVVAEAARAGEVIRYTVRPRYPSATFEGAPSAIRITASGDHGFRLDVTIANTPQATATEAVAPSAGR